MASSVISRSLRKLFRRSSQKRRDLRFTNLRFESLEERIVLSGAPPTVEEVLISGHAWRSAFLSKLNLDGEGNGGFRLTAENAATPLPWTDLDRLSIRFDEAVDVQPSDLKIQGVNARLSVQPDPVGFHYDANTFTATWTIAKPLGVDKYAVRLSDRITNGMGVALDGDGAAPTGDGSAGGDFVFQFAVCPGDGDQNGVTNMHDGLDVRQRMFTTTSSPNYSTRFDFDGSGESTFWMA